MMNEELMLEEQSLSARRAWIEIEIVQIDKILNLASLSARRAWIEISFAPQAGTIVTASLSARRAWIEILYVLYGIGYIAVALRKESVDRNKYVVQCRKVMGVVALRKESVDRNAYIPLSTADNAPSLSARRAWIEMSFLRSLFAMSLCRSPQGERG